MKYIIHVCCNVIDIEKGLKYVLVCWCPTDKPLTGMKLLTVGKLVKNKDDLKVAVEELGGKITGTASKASLCLSTKSEYPVNQLIINIRVSSCP